MNLIIYNISILLTYPIRILNSRVKTYNYRTKITYVICVAFLYCKDNICTYIESYTMQ